MVSPEILHSLTRHRQTLSLFRTTHYPPSTTFLPHAVDYDGDRGIIVGFSAAANDDPYSGM